MSSKRKASAAYLSGTPSVLSPEGGFAAPLLFFSVVTAWGAAASLCCPATAFGLAPSLPALLGAVLGFSLLWCALLLWKKKWIALPVLGLLGLWGWLLSRCWEILWQGGVRVASAVLTHYGERLNFTPELPQLPVNVPLSDRTFSITLVLVFLAFPLTALMAFLLAGCRSALGPFALSGVFLLTSLGMSIEPDAWAMGLMLVFWIFLLFAAPSFRHVSHSSDSRGRVWLAAQRFWRPESLILLPLLALGLLMLLRAFPEERYSRPARVDEIRTQINEGLNLTAVFRGGTGSGGDSVDLNALGERSYTGATVLRVRHTWDDGPPPSYASSCALKDFLKSFVGAEYTGSSWERLDMESVTEEDRLLIQSLRPQTMASRLLETFPPSNDGTYTVYPYTLSVEKVDVDPRSIYSPAGLLPGELPEGIAYVDDGFLRPSGWLSIVNQYSLEADAMVEYGYYLPSLIQTNMEHYDYESWLLFQSYGQRLLETFYEDGGGRAVPEMDLWPIPEEYLPLFGGEEREELLRDAEAYSRFVHETYTQLPEDTRRFALDYLNEHWSSENFSLLTAHYLRGDAINMVRDILHRECRYNLSPPHPQEGEDFVKFFLTEGKQGYCVHFASAAVVLLRAAGIPARYAEGYAVPTGEDGKWVDVPDYNAHAWIEVYWGGSGWIPFEMTPESALAPAAYPTATLPAGGSAALRESLDLSPTPSPSPSPSPSVSPTPDALGNTPAPEGSQPGGGPNRGLLQNLLGILGITLAALSPLLILALQRVIRLAWRRMRFGQKDTNRAALCIYAHLLRLYQENEALPYGGFFPPAEAEAIALKARFSNHKISQEELDTLLDMASALEMRLKERLSEWDRRRCKYLLALF